jgi:hypothetical protein
MRYFPLASRFIIVSAGYPPDLIISRPKASRATKRAQPLPGLAIDCEFLISLCRVLGLKRVYSLIQTPLFLPFPAFGNDAPGKIFTTVGPYCFNLHASFLTRIIMDSLF